MSRDMEATGWGYTHIRVDSFCHKWTISNFSFCMDGIREKIISPKFSLEASDKVEWCLRVHPNGSDEESRNYLSVYLGLLHCQKSPVWAKFKFWIINSQGEKYQSMKRTNVVSFQKTNTGDSKSLSYEISSSPIHLGSSLKTSLPSAAK